MALSIGAWGSIVAGVVLLFRPSNGLGPAIVTIGLAWLLAWVLRGGRLGIKAARSDE
jgi:hypothetical protein